MSPSKIWVFKSHSAFVVEQLDEQLANTFLAARDTGRSDDKGVVGVVGDDLIEVARGERLAVVGEYLLRRTWRRGPHRAPLQPVDHLGESVGHS